MRTSIEFEGAEFGDRRLTARLTVLADQLSTEPDQSFPAAAGDDSALEATYRFLNNDAVTPEKILAPHFRATAERAASVPTVIVAHDSTEFLFKRPGMGYLGENRTGFLGHFSLAVANDKSRSPLGIIAIEPMVRAKLKRATGSKRHLAKDSEGLRWWRGVETANSRLAGSPIHVMDREADSYELFAKMVDAGCRFVIRNAYDRRVAVEGEPDSTIDFELATARDFLTLEIPVSARDEVRHGHSSRREAREARIAKVVFRAKSMTIQRPRWTVIRGPPHLTVNIVWVRELETPRGCEPVEWRLITTEPVETADQVAAVVDAYRARWVIEEYFRALKQGCAFEKRQLENRHAILNALAVLTPIAWDLLALRTASRATPDAPASTALSPLKIRLLEHHPKVRLAANASVRDAMLSIARLGGHLRNNGEPGWIVLGRGYDKLLMMEEGARLALEM
jgi:hypothetical protein